MMMRWFVAAYALIALVASAALAQGAPWVVKRVHGVRFVLAVDSVYGPAVPGKDPRHARLLEHRLRVTILDDNTGSATRVARVTADVAESGYAGTTTALTPVEPRERGVYEGVVWLRTDLPYRILIHAALADGSRTLEAQFEYRHHH